MIPASHLLVGFVVGRLARQACQPSVPRLRPWQDPFIAGSLAASVFPDWDVLPGLVAGYRAVEFHRGATHSVAGAFLQALVMTPVGVALWRALGAWFPRAGFAPPPSARALFLVLFAGMGLHALADALNPWGVAPLWPLSRKGATWNLVHEGDRVFLAATAVCAAAALIGSARTILIASSLTLGSFLAWKFVERADAREIAARELGPATVVYPTPALDCPWSALRRDGEVLTAACISPAGNESARIVRRVHSVEPPLVQASKAYPAVADFLRKRPFPFAEIEQDPGGGVIVLWRDLRESLLEGPDDPRFGLAVSFDRQGRIVSIEQRWMLKLSF